LNLEDNRDDFYMAMMLELHPKNKDSKFASKTLRHMVTRIDENAAAKEARTERSERLKALNVAQGMSDTELIDFADAMQWDSTEEMEVLRNKAEELADTDPIFFNDLVEAVESLKDLGLDMSVSVPPLKIEQMKMLHEKGVSRIGIPLDAATESIFYTIKGKGTKGPYNWEKHLATIKEAQSIFGVGNVSTHLIVGLGETEFDAVKFLKEMIDSQVLPALFTFTPVRGTALESRARPSVKQYRKIQLARYLLLNQLARFDDFAFTEKGELINFGVPKKQLIAIIRTGIPFLTTGCPGCNRPFYNERPGETLFNYPRPMNSGEITEVTKIFEEFGQ